MLASPGPRAHTPPGPSPAPQAALLDELGTQAATLKPDVLRLGLDATACAIRQGLVTRQQILTVIDYSLPSTEPRLWVFELRTRRLLFRELVAHGRNSGSNHTTHFSDRPGSLATSLGLFVTADTYVGRHGYSLRLRGLEAGVNGRAEARAIVLHGAPYVTAEVARKLGRLGRSWGCPAVGLGVAQGLIDTIKGGTVVFAYYPEPGWLASSKFVSRCTAGATDPTGPHAENR
jgi:hypothetical protein